MDPCRTGCTQLADSGNIHKYCRKETMHGKPFICVTLFTVRWHETLTVFSVHISKAFVPSNSEWEGGAFRHYLILFTKCKLKCLSYFALPIVVIARGCREGKLLICFFDKGKMWPSNENSLYKYHFTFMLLRHTASEGLFRTLWKWNNEICASILWGVKTLTLPTGWIIMVCIRKAFRSYLQPTACFPAGAGHVRGAESGVCVALAVLIDSYLVHKGKSKNSLVLSSSERSSAQFRNSLAPFFSLSPSVNTYICI